MNNPLSDIYSKQVLLNEAKKDNVVTAKDKLKIAAGDIEPLAKDGGPEKDIKKGSVKSPTEDGKFSEIKRKKGKSIKENMSTNNKYEGAFEKLFKSTLIKEEDEMGDMAAQHEVEDHADEIPTSEEDMGEDLGAHEDEADNLVSDIKAVIDSLHSILDKLSEHEKEEGHDIEAEIGETEEGEEEEPFEESTDLKALPDSAGKQFVGPKGKFDTKGVKVTKGKANDGEVDVEPEPKELHADHKNLQNTKKFTPKTSNIKVGDFFK